MVCTPLSRRSRRIAAADRSGNAAAGVFGGGPPGAAAVVVLLVPSPSPSSVFIVCATVYSRKRSCGCFATVLRDARRHRPFGRSWRRGPLRAAPRDDSSFTCDLEQRHRVGNAVAPVAQHPRCGGARPRLARTQHPASAALVSTRLFHCWTQSASIMWCSYCGLLLSSRAHPRGQRGQHLVGVAPAQFDLGAVADAILGLLQQIEQGSIGSPAMTGGLSSGRPG